ncbi:hypothetical protein EDC04DRAFT_2598444 [Pisolithus marmoratus]|nr:hypothetical protein EDC04DRAFT_2598444 [Pisolithus marmoratus]
MSNQPSLSHQPTDAPSWDWTQVPDVDLEVHKSNLEGAERAKEVEKSCWEAAKKECRVERQEHEEQERQACEEHKEKERQAACQAAVAEAEGASQSVAKEKGQVGELQQESRGSSVASSRWVITYSPMTGASMGTIRVALMLRQVACEGCRQRGEAGKDSGSDGAVGPGDGGAGQGHSGLCEACDSIPTMASGGAGRVSSVAEGSRLGVEWSESVVRRVAEEGREQNEEDAEGDVEDMQE